MKRYITGIITNPLFSGSAIMILGSNATSFVNYIYHLLMGRLLGPSDYGELAALISLSGLLGIVPLSLGLVIVKYVSSAKTDQEISSLVSWVNQKAFIVSSVIFVLILFSTPIISSFLNIHDKTLVMLVALSFVFALPSYFNKSILQGVLKFKQMVLSLMAENIVKLILGIILVFLGFAVSGAMWAFAIAGFIGFLLSRFFIRGYLKKTYLPKPNIKPMVLYSLPVIIYSIATTSLYSTDLILVKHFFSSHDAGIYAALSNLGKIIFFGAGPIGAVMFPLVSSRYAKGQGYKKIFFFSLLATSSLALGILGLYWLFPELAITALYGSLYLEAADLLIWFGIFITLFTLSALFISFYLSLGFTKMVILPLIAAIFQIIGILFYHQDLKTVVQVSITVNALLLLSLLIYFSHATKISVGDSTGLQTRKNDSKGSKKN